MQKAKRLFEEALQIAMKRKVKGKGEKERYTHLNTECSKEQQGEMRKPFPVINSKKQRKTRMEKLEISSRKLQIPRELFMQLQAQ